MLSEKRRGRFLFALYKIYVFRKTYFFPQCMLTPLDSINALTCLRAMYLM